jgi:radical SAM protein with 4Fe4S-binding SPASM domain
MTEFAVRPEAFGATLYDPQSLSYFFIDGDQYAGLGSFAPVTGDRPTPIPPTLGMDVQADISGGKFAWLMMALNAGSRLRLRSCPAPLPARSLAAPIRVYLEIGLRCNASCAYCLNDAGSARPNELSTEELLRTIENCGRDGVLEMRLTGGEPTLHPALYELARAVQSNGMALSINSNLLIDKNTRDLLIGLGPDLLITSLDAAEEPHSKHRGKGYGLIVENVRRLRTAGIPLRLNCVLSRNTLPHIEQFIDMFAPLGCGFCFILVRPVGRAGEGFHPPPLSEMIAIVKMIENKQRAYANAYFSTSFHVVMDRELTVDGISLTGCNAMQKSFNVNSDGSILPCAFLAELSHDAFTLGNIRDHDYSVLPVWRESELLHTLRQRSSECNLRCINCPRFRDDCLGTCVFMEIYSERTGHPDPYCRRSLEALARELTGVLPARSDGPVVESIVRMNGYATQERPAG